MPLRGVGPLSGGYGVPTFESRTQSIPPTTQNAGRHFSKYRETPHSGQGCGVRKKNHDSHFLITEDTIHTFSHIKDTLASELTVSSECGQMSGKMRYSLQTWPRRAARAGGPPRVPGGAAGGPRPRVRPQPPAASPPQVVWESSEAEKCT